jgi:predicted dehydrogenase
MADRLRIGFIGCGRHSTRILYPSLRLTDLDLVATCSLVDEEAVRNARLFGAERWHVGHEALLEQASDLDACLVAVGPPAYRDVLSAVLETGLPVWAEKPAAGSAAEAAELVTLSERAGLPICVGFNKRFAPAYELARSAVAEPHFGKPSFFAGKFAMGGGLYEDDYTFLVDNSVHMADLMRFFMGDVAAVTVERGEGSDGRVAYAVVVRFESGAVGTLHLSTMQSWRSHNEWVEITGQGSAAVVDNVVGFRTYVPEGPGTAWEPNFTVPSDANQTLMLTGYARELQHFVEVVRDGAPPRATIEDAQRALELIDDIYRAGGGLLAPGQRAQEW